MQSITGQNNNQMLEKCIVASCYRKHSITLIGQWIMALFWAVILGPSVIFNLKYQYFPFWLKSLNHFWTYVVMDKVRSQMNCHGNSTIRSLGKQFNTTGNFPNRRVDGQ